MPVDEVAARSAENAQDAELFRVLAYTGLRLGEAVALRWSDVDFNGRRLVVQRALSGDTETTTKAHRVRHIGLATPTAQARARLAARHDSTGRDEYVFCNRFGGRLDPSAIRRRFKSAAAAAAGLRPLKLHGLRHGAGSLLAREADAVAVQAFLGHAKLTTTERYMHATDDRKPAPHEAPSPEFQLGGVDRDEREPKAAANRRHSVMARSMTGCRRRLVDGDRAPARVERDVQGRGQVRGRVSWRRRCGRRVRCGW